MLEKYKVPGEINYIAAFLTLRCKFGCSYCINRHGKLSEHKEMATDEWIEGLERLVTRPDLPITLQGGEPTMHPGCWEIANRFRGNVDILTNGDFDFEKFICTVPTLTFYRDAKYASIRFSYHPKKHSPYALATKVWYLQCQGYNVGIWGLDHPDYKECNHYMAKACRTYNVDFRLKEFLGYDESGNFHGTLKYKPGQFRGPVECRTSELLISPSGHIHRCHADLYAGDHAIGHILDEKLPDIGQWRKCHAFGTCSHCDTKVKTNRFQEYGHTSVEIKGAGQ